MEHNTHKGCCEACEGFESKSDESLVYCTNPLCICHQTTPSPDGEEWMKEFDISFPISIDYPPPPNEGDTWIRVEMEVKARTNRANGKHASIKRYITSLIKEKEDAIRQEILKIIQEEAEKQDAGIVWANMNLLIMKIAARSTSERVQ